MNKKGLWFLKNLNCLINAGHPIHVYLKKNVTHALFSIDFWIHQGYCKIFLGSINKNINLILWQIGCNFWDQNSGKFKLCLHFFPSVFLKLSPVFLIWKLGIIIITSASHSVDVRILDFMGSIIYSTIWFHSVLYTTIPY